MVGQANKDEEIRRALKIYILREREKQKLEEEAEAEKTRKKKELDEKKLKEESEFKATKDKLSELIKKQEQLKQDRVKVLEHLKKLLADPNNKHVLQTEDITKLVNFGLVVTHVNTVSSQPVYITTVPATALPRASTGSVNSQYKTSSTTPIPVQTLPAQKRSRSPSPFHPSYNYKQAAGPHAFQKFEDTHRSHEYARGYPYKPGSSVQSGAYNPFYPTGQTVAYTHPSSVHNNAAVYSSYGVSREEAVHKSQSSVAPPQTPPQHSSLYGSHGSHRSSLAPGPSPSIQQSNHVSYLVDHSKGGQSYPEDKYMMVRPGHVPVHAGAISIQQSPQGNKHGSITSGYPVRPVAQIGPQTQLHIQASHSGHHGSQTSHHSSQPPPHHSSMPHHSGPSHLSSSQQSQSHLSQPHHYPPHSQSQMHHSSSQQSHSSPQPPVSIQSHHSNQHHQQHMQPLHVSSHHPSAGSHHQLLARHPSSIHHTSSQQHLQQAIHHQQVLQQSHSQQLHHQQMSQPHIQQHISPHQSQLQGQQSQPTSVVTSQAYVNQMNAIQGGNRLIYSQSNIPH